MLDLMISPNIREPANHQESSGGCRKDEARPLVGSSAFYEIACLMAAKLPTFMQTPLDRHSSSKRHLPVV